ncbi:MAG: hypothetical protein ACI4W6_07540 [Acutalibacteraceae bacterium]
MEKPEYKIIFGVGGIGKNSESLKRAALRDAHNKKEENLDEYLLLCEAELKKEETEKKKQ